MGQASWHGVDPMQPASLAATCNLQHYLGGESWHFDDIIERGAWLSAAQLAH